MSKFMGRLKWAHRLMFLGLVAALTLPVQSVWGMGGSLNDLRFAQTEWRGLIFVGITMLLPVAVWIALAAARTLMNSMDDEVSRTRSGVDAELKFERQVAQSEEAAPLRCVVELAPGAGEAIADVARMVEALAFQAHMLALNAVVEATRAGDHGHGFTIVADEVRQLAQRAAEAAKQLNRLILASTENAAAAPTLTPQTNVTMQEAVASIRRVTETSWQKSSTSTHDQT